MSPIDCPKPTTISIPYTSKHYTTTTNTNTNNKISRYNATNPVPQNKTKHLRKSKHKRTIAHMRNFMYHQR